MIKWVIGVFHGTGDDSFGGDGIKHLLVLKNDEPGDIRDNLSLLELFQVQDLDVG